MSSDRAGRPPAPRSEGLFERAQRSLVGGVDSPVRAFRSVGGAPRFLVRGKGAYIWDADRRKYVDYCMSWGALLFGHADPAIVRAVRDAAGRGTSFGAATEAEVRLAEEVKKRFRSIDLLRFVSSGTEATMSAVRVARGFTGRDKIVVFGGAYHGHADALLVKAGSGVAAAELSASAGVPQSAVRDTLVAEYNDVDSVEDIFRTHPNEIAAVLVEPVAANMGLVPPERGFLSDLRRITRDFDSLLVFDEVVTGFRVAPGGAQEKYGVTPDLTCLGKILGHGLPVGAYGGRREIMERVAPLGPVYQAGTLSGNPLAMAAGLATMRGLRPDLFRRLEEGSARVAAGLRDAASEAAVDFQVPRVGSMLGLFFRPDPVRNFGDARASDVRDYRTFFWSLLTRGVYLPPAPFETLFLSSTHEGNEIERTIEAASAAFAEVRNS